MKFSDILSAFKDMEGEYIENMIQLTEDTTLRNGFLAWQSMDVVFSPDSECPPNIVEEKRQWAWLWSTVKIDYKMFSVVANIREYDATSLLERLRSLRLVYPDGTCNLQAKKFVREQVTANRPGFNLKLRHQLKEQSKNQQKEV